MKFKTLALFATVWLVAPFIHADDHEFVGGIDVNAPFNLQVQMCSLLDGVTQEDYDALIKDYFKWSKKHDVEVTFIRQVPLFSHATANNPSAYDFIEYLASDHASSGRGWDKWLTTKDGQKLAARWAKLAQCDVKMAHVEMIWTDVEAMNSDRDRVVTWNWCTRKDGVSWDQLSAKHRSVAAARNEASPNIGWAAFYPHIGGAYAPGELAHIVIYPDVESLMKGAALNAQGGWRVLDDYYTSYADCSGESARLETIMYQPGD